MTGERGSVTVLMCAAAFMLMTGGVALADAGVMLVARSRAQAAAEAAALAAIVEQIPALSSGRDPAAVAREEARRNGAEMTDCECRYGDHVAKVTVGISAPVLMLPGWTGRSVRASAAAETDAGLTSYRP